MSRLLFALAFPTATPFWALMILAPRWRWTRRIAGSPLIILPTLVVYLLAVLPILPHFATQMLNPQFTGVQTILTGDAGTATVWAQLIAFDLFIGRWIYLDSAGRGIHPVFISLILLLTIVLSPFGLIGYLVLRATRPTRTAGANTGSTATPAPMG